MRGITESGKAQFAGSLRNMCALSDLKMNRLLNLIDEWAQANGFDGMVEPPHRLPPTEVEEAPPLALDLANWRDQRQSFGPPAIAPTIPGSSFLFSIARGWSVMTAGWFHLRAYI